MLEIFRGISRPIWLLFGINLINRIGSMVLCFLSLYLTESLHFSLPNAGLAMSCYGLGAITGQFLGGYLTDRFGYHNVQLGSLTLNGFAVLCIPFIHSFWGICTILFVLNVISESFRPANSTAITMNSDEATRTRSFSLVRIAFNLAIMFSLTLGGWLVTKSWNLIFWADSLSCFAAAIALFFFVPTTSRADISTRKNAKTAPDSLSSPWRDPLYRLFIAATFFNALAFMNIIWTIPPFFKTVYHWDEFTIGCVSAINGFLVMLIEMPLVTSIEKRLPTIKIIRLGIILYAFAYACFLLPVQFMWLAAIAYMTLISFGEVFAMPFSTTWAAKRAPAALSGKYMAAYGFAYSLANVIAPFLGTQIIARFGYPTHWLLTIAFCGISYAIFYKKEFKV